MPLLFAYNKVGFSHEEAHIKLVYRILHECSCFIEYTKRVEEKR